MGDKQDVRDKSFVIVHPKDVLHRTELFSASTLLFASIVTYLPLITRQQLAALQVLPPETVVTHPLWPIVKSLNELVPFVTAGTLTTIAPASEGRENLHVDHAIYDFYSAICYLQTPIGDFHRKHLPAHWEEDYGSLIEYLGRHLLDKDTAFEIEVTLTVALWRVSDLANIPQFLMARRKPTAEAEVLARFSKTNVPILRGAEPEQLLMARDVLKDELHPLRLELKKVALMVAAEQDEAAVNAVIAEQLTPHLVDYRRAFHSRTTTLLTSAQAAVKDLYLGTFIFGPALFTSPDPGTLATIAGTAFGGAIADATARYVVARHKQDEAKAKHPFGFLQYLEKK